MARKPVDPNKNHLYYGDNLEVLRDSIPSESVDLVYLDPPFNSNRAYSVLFKEKSGNDSQAQLEAFDDTWTWSQESEELYESLMVSPETPNKVKDALQAFRQLLGDNDVLAYLVMMAARLIELHRVLKPTGSLWLHCDPTASHYLKVLLDSIFGAEHFLNEIIWKRAPAKGLARRRLPTNHDVILGYGASAEVQWISSAQFISYDDALDARTEAQYRLTDSNGRRYRLASLINPNPDRPNLTYEFLGVTKVWRWTKDRMQEAYEAGRVIQSAPGRVPQQVLYLDEQKGKPLSDVWTDIIPLQGASAERLGYPTQKPLALLERIIALTTKAGDIVLDPFCGCGTTVAAAQHLGRRWIGIDITTLAIDLIDARLRHTYGNEIQDTYEILGIPRDMEGAKALFARSPFEFERWCVMQLDGQPNQKQVGDKGVDGVIRFVLDGKGKYDRALISVKGGATGPSHVRDLSGTVQHQGAAMGVFVCMAAPTRAMMDEANHSGIYKHPGDGKSYPRVQIITVPEMLAGKRPQLPPTMLPYITASRRGGNEVMDALV